MLIINEGNNMKLKSILIIFSIIIVLMLSYPVKAETIIYDNITSSNYKILKIDDISNIKILNEYGYEVYINDYYIGNYKKDENIFIPDNSNITIFITSPIKTDFNTSFELFKNMWIIILGIVFTFGILIIFLIWIIKKSWRMK
ncbi:MAG: hypothetical protein Q7T55_26480 [Solirubrobacteraceae bacterium]|nr:hypothetical protein [Solirubrobacteraceae bacterium]